MRKVGAALITVLWLSACGGRDGVTEVGGIPVLEGHTRGPGTELGDGLTVVDGSVLLGRPLPPQVEYGSAQPERHGWRALLLVTGNARAVLDGYGREAAAIGLPLSPAYAPGTCITDGRGVLTCQLEGNEGSYDHGRRVTVHLQRAERSADRPPLSHLFIEYTRTGEPPYPGPGAEPCQCELGRVPVDRPDDWPQLPRDGEPYEASLPHQDAMDVERGSRLVAHPGAPLGLWSAALFVVTGDPEEVLDRYEHQKRAYDEYERRGRYGGGTHLHRFWGSGGGTYIADLVIRPGRPTYLLIAHSSTD